ncbi:MFS transporter [Microbacterium sediminicola]|uniref:MFS transporter n=1 Tax=Microbacterium sediminicola TaxID=415210 RepID=A0ABN2HXH2_9MICO
MTDATTTGTAMVRLRRMSVAAAGAYGVQGLGYAVVVTALPSFQARHALDETAVSLILLGVVVAAAAGSVLADLLAVRRNSRFAVIVGFALQIIGLTGAALSPEIVLFVVSILVYGVGLGTIDAASNMQGVLVQRHWGRPILGRLFAVYTVAAIVGAMAMSAGISLGSGATFALLIAAGMQLVYLLAASRALDPERAARQAGTKAGRLPRMPIFVVGLVVFAVFTMDAGLSTWSSVHLVDMGTAAALAPLGYALYQAGVLIARLAVDPVERRVGTRRVALAALIAGAVGSIAFALIPVFGVAVFALFLAGLCSGALIPIAFGMAGRIDPARSDEIVARVNIYNYGGALIGTVGVGLLLDAGGPALAFIVPALVLLLALPALRSHATPKAAPGVES